MSYVISIPIVNPLHITLEDFVNAAQYNSKHIDDWQFEDTIRNHEQYVEWYQPWQQNDIIPLQIHSQLGPIQIRLMDVHGNIVSTTSMTQVARDFFDIDKFIYQASVSLTSVPPGFYRCRILFGSPAAAIAISNWFEVAEKFENSLRIDYTHHKPHEDAYFSHTSWQPCIRTYGCLEYEEPGSNAVMFEDQLSDMELLDNKSFDTHRWYTGGPEGIPNWAIRKYNKIAGCSTLKIDGRLYTKASANASFEKKDEKDYPMRGWSLLLRDKLNRASRILEVDDDVVQNNLGLIVVGNTDSKGFVSDNAGVGYQEVSDVQ